MLPSIIIGRPDGNKDVIVSNPTTAGMPRERARIAVCDVRPPTSVTKPTTLERSICTVSAGDRSWATTMTCSSTSVRDSCVSPSRLRNNRSPIESISERRSRRYSSLILSKTRRNLRSTRFNAPSALIRSSRIRLIVSPISISSSRIIR